MKLRISLLFILISLISCTQTSTVKTTNNLVPGSAKSVGISEERLARIDSMCNKAIEDNQVPGMVALVARDGKIVYHKAFGMADNEAGRAMKTDDIFRIASQTKAITATAVMMLWEEGLFSLDDPISKYIPEFGEAQVLDTFNENDSSYTTIPADKQITIRHLLTHTSGIGYGYIDDDPRISKIYKKAGVTDLFTTEPIKIEESIKKLAKLPLHHNPGEKFTYSEGLDVMGYFIEIVSGMPLDQFFRDKILDPLGMDDTWFYLPDSKANRLAPIQTWQDDHWLRFIPPLDVYDPDYPVKGAKTYFAGGAGLCSTAKDYATFLQMYLNKGELNGVRLLSRTTVNFMMENQFSDVWKDSGWYYGLAFSVLTDKGEASGGSGTSGTFSWGGYFNTQYFADPSERIIGVIMKQTHEFNDTGWKFKQLVGQGIDD